ncbi:MAG: hypothetical protein OXC95_04115 [Dehalococcoidia bacterium]|nr:hypothetical protein [Dehalococcoidia bacterium]
MAQTNEQVGNLIMEYRDNLKTIACLSNELHKAGKVLAEVGKSLMDNPLSIKSEDVLHIGLEGIGEKLRELNTAKSTNDRLENCLRQAGLEFAIYRPEPNTGQVTVNPQAVFRG